MRLGYASPARMLGEMRLSELGTWLAIYETDPWGEERADLRAGIIASTMANIHRASGTPPFEATDFMPNAPSKKQTLKDRLIGFLKGRPKKKAQSKG